MEKIKWGVIGTGRIARAFTAALAGTPAAELYAVGSRTAGKSASFAEEYGFTKAYSSYDELFSDENVDIVYIATPMAAHYENCITALKNGRNVLCEKTVTLNAEQLRMLLALAKKKELFFMEAMWTKCRPAYLKMKEWISAGRIGDIRYIKADFSNLVPYNANDRLFRPDCGGGALLDVTVYPLTLAVDILGKPDEIISSAHINEDGIDLSDSFILRYKNGCFASVDGGFELPLKNNAVISGTEGSVILGDGFFMTNTAALYDKNGNITDKFEQPERINGYEYEIDEVHRCLRNGLKESPLVPHSGTLDVLDVMDHARKEWGMRFPQE